MAPSRDQRVELLSRALQMETRSFVEYIGESAPSLDLSRYPNVAEAFRTMIREKRELADRISEAIHGEDAEVFVTVAFDPRFTQYNYITTKYALTTIKSEIRRAIDVAEGLLERAAGDDDIDEALLTELVELERRHLGMVEQLSTAPSAIDPKPPAASNSVHAH